jgi:hypothetical protein
MERDGFSRAHDGFLYGFDGLISVFAAGLVLGFVRKRTNTTCSADTDCAPNSAYTCSNPVTRNGWNSSSRRRSPSDEKRAYRIWCAGSSAAGRSL